MPKRKRSGKFVANLKNPLAKITGSPEFACGGNIPVKAEANLEGQTRKVSNPVTICFWKTDDSPKKLVLPLEDPSSTSLSQIVADCEPAGFGRGKENVLDLEYRRAGKLDPSKFITSFNLADFRLLETIEQILAPPLAPDQDEYPYTPRRIQAELYKLNVYSGPSGLFQKHVDSPRSENQIGSLVVCLPSPFKGGNLIIRHGGKEMDFDWERRSANTIQWAAFYSDCEHEIKTFTHGDRITLTYNLFINDIRKPLTAESPSPFINPEAFPLYEDLRNILEMPGFMTSGGVLGIFCSHAYPHTSHSAQRLLPQRLKGKDFAVYSILGSLGIKAEILPVLIEEDEDSSEGSSSSSDTEDYLIYQSVGKKVHIGSHLKEYFNTSNFEEESLSTMSINYLF
ncbi:hypothetical protein N7520_001878 [Penicillium odoratum]|uniref:uncharacterized protein n=1 Tax=Penicillium odoratum TaxID=1167516 RepID=UPI002546E5DA|nr:uncharacterized protein N7520_001878 [Penicillium odoratum]KAJ5778632.1 hypothetical protein N7520_001878 [Penicillium odoratum]